MSRAMQTFVSCTQDTFPISMLLSLTRQSISLRFHYQVRFVQWHNLAFITTFDLQVPTMVVHYENYTDNYNQTKDMLLDFLDQPQINEPPAFVTGKTYREYFTDEEIKAVSAMFAKLAMDATWLHTKHYFD